MSGFRALRQQGQGDYTGKLETYSVNSSHATLLASGDVIDLTGGSDADGRSEVDAGSAGAPILGIIASIEPLFSGENLTETGLPASTAGKVNCHIDPNQVFEVDTTATLVADDVGLNADAIFSAATKTGGMTISNMKLDSSTKATTGTLQFRIVKLTRDSNGVLGNRAQVRFNNTRIRGGVAGV